MHNNMILAVENSRSIEQGHAMWPPAAVLAVKLMSYKQVAALLQVTERTVYNLVKRGLLVSVKIGNCIRFDPADVQAYIMNAKGVQNAN